MGEPREEILKSLGENVTISSLFKKFVSYGRNNGWVYNTAQSSAGQRLLEGKTTQGNCKAFADALGALAKEKFGGKYEIARIENNEGFMVPFSEAGGIAASYSGCVAREGVKNALAIFNYHYILEYKASGNDAIIYLDPTSGFSAAQKNFYIAYLVKAEKKGNEKTLYYAEKGNTPAVLSNWNGEQENVTLWGNNITMTFQTFPTIKYEITEGKIF